MSRPRAPRSVDTSIGVVPLLSRSIAFSRSGWSSAVIQPHGQSGFLQVVEYSHGAFTVVYKDDDFAVVERLKQVDESVDFVACGLSTSTMAVRSLGF